MTPDERAAFLQILAAHERTVEVCRACAETTRDLAAEVKRGSVPARTVAFIMPAALAVDRPSVMARLVPAMHVLLRAREKKQDGDARHKVLRQGRPKCRTRVPGMTSQSRCSVRQISEATFSSPIERARLRASRRWSSRRLMSSGPAAQ